ncbi:MAG: cytochrome c [Betaproteobacteria bacterium]|nr:MAG: cytochrome c [Betaproteobacteria bacterium]
MRLLLLLTSLMLGAGVVIAAEQRVVLKEGPGRDKVEANCTACHSLDYIVGNSPFMSRQVWDAEVTKMIKVFGAPISEGDAKEIADYLTKNYGPL